MILFAKHLLSAAFFPGTFVFIVWNMNNAVNSSVRQKQANLQEKFTLTCSTAPNAILMTVASAKDYSYPRGFECNTTASYLKESGSL
jgi:hypothetical protein